MAHSDFIYLMGPDGRYLTHFRARTPRWTSPTGSAAS